MHLVLKNGASKEDIAAIEKMLPQSSLVYGFDAKKFNGILPFYTNPLIIQQELREEWERNINDKD